MRLSRFLDYEKMVVFGVWGNYTVHVILTDNIEQSFKKRFPGMHHGFDFTQAFHVIHKPSNGHSYLFFKRGDMPVGTIAHECWHAVHALLKHVDVDEFDNETVAYHLGYLVQQVVEFDGAIKSKSEVIEDVDFARRKNGRLQGVQSGRKEKKRTSSHKIHEYKRHGRVVRSEGIIGGVGRGRK